MSESNLSNFKYICNFSNPVIDIDVYDKKFGLCQKPTDWWNSTIAANTSEVLPKACVDTESKEAVHSCGTIFY